MKKFLLLFCWLLRISAVASAQTYELSSPDGHLNVQIIAGKNLSFSLYSHNVPLLKNNKIALRLSSEILGENPRIRKHRQDHIKETIKPVVPLKFSEVSNEYNLLTLDFSKNFSMQFRMYNEGFAYRYMTDRKKPLEIMNEELSINFPKDYRVHMQQTSSFKTSYENSYSHVNSSQFGPDIKMSTLPVLIEARDGAKILISESDLQDYPAMFLKGDQPNHMSAQFPTDPLEFEDEGDRSMKILKRADYIAKTEGKRNFPWRYFVVTTTDGDLIQNTMTLKLAPKNALKNTDWIKPGQVSWEWWNGASPYKVDFVSGFNEETYKYFIDFASEFGILP